MPLTLKGGLFSTIKLKTQPKWGYEKGGINWVHSMNKVGI